MQHSRLSFRQTAAGLVALFAVLSLTTGSTSSDLTSPTVLSAGLVGPVSLEKETVENGGIYGTVVDETGAPMPRVQVALDGTTIGTMTGEEGSFRIDNVPPGRYSVVATRIGYSRKVAEETEVVDGAWVRVDFELEPTVLSLQELRVSGVPGPAGIAAPYTVGRITVDAAALRVAIPSTDPNREGYAHIEENRFQSPLSSPLSTFSIDVDRASYSNVRRFLNRGRLPPADAVRIEELVNYFTYDYAEPDAGQPFSVTTEIAAAPWNPSNTLVRIGLKAPSVDLSEMPPNNLVFLLDVSGSMDYPNKLPLLKRSLAMLVNELREEDRVSIVVYAGAAGLVLPSTTGTDTETILGALERLGAGGSTAGGAGIRLAYDVARQNFIDGGNNRVILATDGDFNVGASSDAEMVRLIEEERESGVFLTVLGFGTGNLQDSKMEQLADHGNGNFAYIDDLTEARKVLVTEMGGTLLTVAKDVKLQIEFNPARVAQYRLIGYENRLLAAEDFDDDTKDAGEIGAGHTVTALYEIIPTSADANTADDPLRYQASTDTPAAMEDELLFVKIRYKAPDGDESRLLTHVLDDADPGAVRGDFAFAAAVVEFGMLLRESAYAPEASFEQVRALAEEGLGEDRNGYRAGFLEMVDAAQTLREQRANCEGPNVPCTFGPGR